MYNTPEEYMKASDDTGLKVGDIVFLERGPMHEDGKAVIFDINRLWIEYYRSIRKYIGFNYIINYISPYKLMVLDKIGDTPNDCEYLIPFFLLRGYDHHYLSLVNFSKSKFLEFDKIVKELTYV